MPDYKRSATPEDIEKMRDNLKAFHDLHDFLRTSVKGKATERGLNEVQVSRLTNLRSSSIVRDFYEGRRMVGSGEVLRATVEFSEIGKEWLAEFQELKQHLNDKQVTFISHGPTGIDFACDVHDAFYRLAGQISMEEFASLFGEASGPIEQILNTRVDGLNTIFANTRLLAFCKTILRDQQRLAELIAAIEKESNESYVLKLKELNDIRSRHPELRGTKAKAAEALRIPKTTFVNASSYSNPYRHSAIEKVLEVARRLDRGEKNPADEEQSDHALDGAEAIVESFGDVRGGSHSNVSQGEKSEVVHRLVKGHLSTLEIHDLVGMVSRARIESERLRLTLQQLLRCSDEEVLAKAKTILGEELRELHDILYIFSSNAGLEELMDLIEQEREMRDVLSH